MKTALCALAVLASVVVPVSAQQADRQTRLPLCTVRENHGKMERVKQFEALANQARTRGDSRAVFNHYTAALCELRRASKKELGKNRWYAAAANVDFRYWIANTAAGLGNSQVCVAVLSPVLNRGRLELYPAVSVLLCSETKRRSAARCVHCRSGLTASGRELQASGQGISIRRRHQTSERILNAR